ncbi:MAG: hypothetical protein M3O46_02435 [Myxococcota bacterium]|nr:hypothetical protein [Myxococcota bacterium]
MLVKELIPLAVATVPRQCSGEDVEIRDVNSNGTQRARPLRSSGRRRISLRSVRRKGRASLRLRGLPQVLLRRHDVDGDRRVDARRSNDPSVWVARADPQPDGHAFGLAWPKAQHGGPWARLAWVDADPGWLNAWLTWPDAYLFGPSVWVASPDAYLFGPSAWVAWPDAYPFGPRAWVAWPDAHLFGPRAWLS